MPHNKSCKKRLKQDKERRQSNRDNRAGMRSTLKNFRAMCETGEDKSPESLNAIYRTLDVQARKGIIPRKRASRMKARMAALVAKERARSDRSRHRKPSEGWKH